MATFDYTAKTKVPNTKKRIPKQNKNIRNGIFMPPPAGMEAKPVSDEEFLNVFAKRKKGGVKSARSLLTSD
jgi:hypothetical protein